MPKCSCYKVEERYMYNPVFHRGDMKEYSYCNGTKERDECSCGGDMTKCDFYPNVREKALKETAPQLGEWISVNDRLPDDDRQKYLVCIKSNMTNYHWVDTLNCDVHAQEWIHKTIEGRLYYQVTHWMPFPSVPTN